MKILVLAGATLAVLMGSLLLVYLLRRMQRRALEEVTLQLHRVVVGGALRGRVELATDLPEVASLVTVVNHMLTRASNAAPEALPAPSAPLSALGDQLHEIVLIHGSRGILYANPQFANLIGTQPAELIGRRLEDLVPPEYSELVGKHIRHSLAGEPAAPRYEIELLGLQGQLARLELSAAPVIHEGQRALLVVGAEIMPTQTAAALGVGSGMRSRARAALTAMAGAVATLDAQGRIDYLNPAAALLLGVDDEAAKGMAAAQLLSGASEADQQRLADLVQQALTAGTPVNGASGPLSLGAHGAERLLEATVVPLRSEAGDVDGAVLTLNDVTAARQSAPQGSVQDSPVPGSGVRSRAWAALTSMPGAVATLDAQGHIDYLNPAAALLLGVDGAASMGMAAEQLLSGASEADQKLLADLVQQALTAGTPVNLGRRPLSLGQGGAERLLEATVAPLRSDAGDVDGAVLTLTDVTESRGLTRQISYQAAHDALTGLVNRREFERRLQESVESARRGDANHVLCYLDLDRFKAINDSSGHQAGDGLLREIAKVLRTGVRDSDTVGRLGGDEFGMLLVGCPLDKARQIADEICRKVADHRFVWRDRFFNVGASIGLVEISAAASSIEELLAAADSACYQAKRQGGHVTVYSARDESLARESGEIQWLQLLQSALKEHRFELYCQPIIAAHGDGDAGPAMEMLLRLRNDAGEQVSPADFLQAAERYRLMGLVDRQVVQTTFDALGRRAIKLPAKRSVGINISGQTLADSQFLEFVVECFDSTGANPAQVCFEIAEGAVIANLEHARRFIGVLHGMGCRFALDDFGSGIGSFAKLQSLAIDFLKIDGSFMRNLARDSVNQAMVTAMIKLARTLNFKVIAEHIEDDSSAAAARGMGVDYLQGYAMGRPMPLSLAA